MKFYRIKLISDSLICSLLFFSVFFCGCGYHDQIPSHAVEISNKNNTFKVEARSISLFEKEKLKAVQISEIPNNTINSSNHEIYWWIVAEQPVDTESLEITAGIVPDGFVQKIPADDIFFLPIPGKKYRVDVQMDYRLSPPWMGIDWTAK